MRSACIVCILTGYIKFYLVLCVHRHLIFVFQIVITFNFILVRMVEYKLFTLIKPHGSFYCNISMNRAELCDTHYVKKLIQYRQNPASRYRFIKTFKIILYSETQLPSSCVSTTSINKCISTATSFWHRVSLA